MRDRLLTQASWWQQNRKWALPVGVAGLVLAMGLMSFIIVLYLGITTTFKNSTPFQLGMSLASDHSVIQEKIGLPLKPGFFITGNFSTNNHSGEASLKVPIKGPKGSGTLWIDAEKSGKTWVFRRLTMSIHQENGDLKINLLKESYPDL